MNVPHHRVGVCSVESTQRFKEQSFQLRVIHFILFFFSNENSTDDMTEKHRRGGAWGPEHNWTGGDTVVGVEGGVGWASKSTKWSKRYRIKNLNFFIYIFI